GWKKACKANIGLAKGLNIIDGQIVYEPIANAFNLPHHTLENILATNYYTLNHINPSIYEKAHHTSARYPREQSEFEATELTPHYEQDFAAPYVQESILKIGLKLEEHTTLAINDTVLVIGSIQQVILENELVLQEDGFLDLELAQTVTSSGLDSYHTTQKLGRLAYAKPKSSA
ncbi:MAG: flavin reductase, partial [Flammeovirgaceae bacterium]